MRSANRKPCSTLHPKRKPIPDRDLSSEYLFGVPVGNRKQTVRVLTQNRGRGFISKPSSDRTADFVAHIAQKLRQNRVFVPQIVEIDSMHNLVHSEKSGKTLYRLLEQYNHRPSTPLCRHILQTYGKIFRMMGRVHQSGIEHTHPNVDNIIINGNQVGLIDLKYVNTPACGWKSAINIMEAFANDYLALRAQFSAIEALARTIGQEKTIRRRLLSQMVRQYPCSPKIKQQVVEILLM